MNHAFSKILIVVILAALIGGGILAWQYLGAPEEAETPEELLIIVEDSLYGGLAEELNTYSNDVKRE